MFKKNIFTLLAVLAFLVLFNNKVYSQANPVMYFCEVYGSEGEVNISDRFTTGFLTVMIKCDYPMYLTDVVIEFQKYNESTKTFSFYKEFYYEVDPDMSYIYFSKTDKNDMSFDSPGIYRAILFDQLDQFVASALVEVISK